MPQNGDGKVCRFFALMPVRIGFKVRWLVMVRVRYVYVESRDESGWSTGERYWRAEEFLNPKK